MRLCVLETDTNSDTDLRKHGSISEQFHAWLSPALPEAEWTSIAVHDGAALPAPEAHDAYLITGSRHGVYDALPWMGPLTAFIQTLRETGIPLGGICFGHQIMAHAYGARVEKSDQGWILGAQTYDGNTAFAMHQDQVLDVPQGANAVTAAPKCGIARLGYDFSALSVQYHPEFTREFMEELLNMYGNGEIDETLIAQARASLDAPLHVDRIAHDFAAFFRDGVR